MFTLTGVGSGSTRRDRYKPGFRINNLFDRFYIPNANASGPSYRAGPTSTSPSITTNSWVPPRDVFRFLSVRLDVKYQARLRW